MLRDISATLGEYQETDHLTLVSIKYRNYRERLPQSDKYNYMAEHMLRCQEDWYWIVKPSKDR